MPHIILSSAVIRASISRIPEIAFDVLPFADAAAGRCMRFRIAPDQYYLVHRNAHRDRKYITTLRVAG